MEQGARYAGLGIEVTGLLMAGALVPVPGLTIISPASNGGPSWARLDTGDYRARPTSWIRQIILHTTGGLWPQAVHPGTGKPGHAQSIAEMWYRDPVHSAAQIVVDYDGTVVCLCDLTRTMAYHSEGSNPWSIGIEMCTMSDGGIYEATLDAAVKLTSALTANGPGMGLYNIPAQIQRGPYRNHPLHRMEVGSGSTRHNTGGPDCVGVFGHRDNTENRGFGDPGDEIFRRLSSAGFEEIDYETSEDLHIGQRRQRALNTLGAKLIEDGVVGPASMAAMRHLGFSRWRDVD